MKKIKKRLGYWIFAYKGQNENSKKEKRGKVAIMQ